MRRVLLKDTEENNQAKNDVEVEQLLLKNGLMNEKWNNASII